jgi:hypothetical protein
MICSHFLRSQAKLVLVVASMRSRARSPSDQAQHGEPLQPFCGALISTSTLLAAMSTQTVPEATQSSTNKPVDRAHGSADRLQVVIRQDHAGGGFDVRREDDGRLVFADGGTTSAIGTGQTVPARRCRSGVP